MDRFKDIGETILLFVIMGIFTILKSGLSKQSRWDIWRSLSKFFVNIIAGVGFYSFLLSYKDWFGSYPQKIGVIMFTVYIGSRLIDLVVDKSFETLKGMNLKEIIKHLFNL